jgi:hypothetical protein
MYILYKDILTGLNASSDNLYSLQFTYSHYDIIKNYLSSLKFKKSFRTNKVVQSITNIYYNSNIYEQYSTYMKVILLSIKYNYISKDDALVSDFFTKVNIREVLLNDNLKFILNLVIDFIIKGIIKLDKITLYKLLKNINYKQFKKLYKNDVICNNIKLIFQADTPFYNRKFFKELFKFKKINIIINNLINENTDTPILDNVLRIAINTNNSYIVKKILNYNRINFEFSYGFIPKNFKIFKMLFKYSKIEKSNKLMDKLFIKLYSFHKYNIKILKYMFKKIKCFDNIKVYCFIPRLPIELMIKSIENTIFGNRELKLLINKYIRENNIEIIKIILDSYNRNTIRNIFSCGCYKNLFLYSKLETINLLFSNIIYENDQDNILFNNNDIENKFEYIVKKINGTYKLRSLMIYICEEHIDISKKIKLIKIIMLYFKERYIKSINKNNIDVIKILSDYKNIKFSLNDYYYQKRIDEKTLIKIINLNLNIDKESLLEYAMKYTYFDAMKLLFNCGITSTMENLVVQLYDDNDYENGDIIDIENWNEYIKNYSTKFYYRKKYKKLEIISNKVIVKNKVTTKWATNLGLI